MLEAIEMAEGFAGKKLEYSLLDDNRIGDHIWYVSDLRKFQKRYPGWELKYDIKKSYELKF